MVRAPIGMFGLLNSAMCVDVAYVLFGISTRMGLGSGRTLLRKGELNCTTPKFPLAPQSIIVGVGGPELCIELLANALLKLLLC